MNPPKMPDALYSNEELIQSIRLVSENTFTQNILINNDISNTNHPIVIEHDLTTNFLDNNQKTEGSSPYAPAPRVILGSDDVTLPWDFMPTNLDPDQIPAEYCDLCQQLWPFRLSLSINELISPSQVSRTFRRDESIPRPQNAFIIYRRNLVASLKNRGGDIKFHDISDEASEAWRKERQEVKQFFKCLAVMGKIVHNKKWPGYIYKPKRKAKGQRDGGTYVSGDETDGNGGDESEEIECLNAMVNECCNIMSDHDKKDVLYKALSKQMKSLRKRQQSKRASKLTKRKKKRVIVNKNNSVDYDTGWKQRNNIESIEGMENGGTSGDGRSADESHDNIELSGSHYDCSITGLSCDPDDTGVVNVLDGVQTNGIEDYGTALDQASAYPWFYSIPPWSGNEGVSDLMSENVCNSASERTEECVSTVNGYNGMCIGPEYTTMVGCDLL
ncbi:6409_t:CDS:1 [Paraglomus occultum]|uniref:6409_t:CDS:1 n=1 Tax=Paraglomus occultum TaxID=144539 RepID=A0A9N8VQH6_9GLOM|nr:6409_t:CDS:1 [Paraglomus occultum]